MMKTASFSLELLSIFYTIRISFFFPESDYSKKKNKTIFKNTQRKKVLKDILPGLSGPIFIL